jgi:hypothetical protein
MSNVIRAWGVLPIATSANSHSIDLELGSAQYLSRADQAAFDLAGDVTLEANVKFESLPTADDASVVCKGTQAGGDGTGNYWIIWRPAVVAGTDQWNSNFRQAGVNNAISYGHLPTVAVWYHVAVTRKASDGETKFYLDGSLVQTTANTLGSDLVNNTSAFTIGASAVPGKYFDGLIDDVRLWSVVRTGTEIANNRSLELVGNETGLVGYWKLNNALTDETANALTLTNNGSAVFSTDAPF